MGILVFQVVQDMAEEWEWAEDLAEAVVVVWVVVGVSDRVDIVFVQNAEQKLRISEVSPAIRRNVQIVEHRWRGNDNSCGNIIQYDFRHLNRLPHITPQKIF